MDGMSLRKKLFNMDLHISVIEDFKNLFPEFHITHWCLSGHAWVFNRNTEYPDIINPETWQQIDDDMIIKFQNKYDNFLNSFDGFICGHPNVFAMIFEKYNKPIILINSCRYDIPFCWSRKLHVLQRYTLCLNRLKTKNLLIAVSNNKADQLYTKLGCDIDTHYIPSLCAYTGMKYNPTRNTFLCYSGNVDHPLITKKSELGRSYKWEELCKFKGIIHFPYEISTMSMFEQFTSGIPLFFPSKQFMLNNVNIQSVSAYWSNSLPENLKKLSDKSIWIENADFYNVFQSPNIYLFDSISHLIILLETFKWKDDSAILDRHRSQIKDKWTSLLTF